MKHLTLFRSLNWTPFNVNITQALFSHTKPYDLWIEFYFKTMDLQVDFIRNNSAKSFSDTNNETDGYRQHFFRYLILVKMALCEEKLFFFQKTLFLLHFTCFSNLEYFLVFSEKPQNRAREIFIWISNFSHALYKKIATFSCFVRVQFFFFGKTSLIFRKNPNKNIHELFLTLIQQKFGTKKFFGRVVKTAF